MTLYEILLEFQHFVYLPTWNKRVELNVSGWLYSSPSVGRCRKEREPPAQPALALTDSLTLYFYDGNDVELHVLGYRLTY